LLYTGVEDDMKKFFAGLTFGALLLIATSVGVACGGMTETAPGVFEGTGKYSGKTYREAAPGEGGTAALDRSDGQISISYYVELTPSELANMTKEEQEAAKQAAGPPPPPPMYKVSPSKVKLTAVMPTEKLPEQAKETLEEEELILA
jgi:hypothetical protein